MLLQLSITRHDIASDIVANVPQFSVLATKTQKSVSKLATKTTLYILT